ncbi:hypothetical protein Aple_056750 [Acrocarpospora pleiomorpha]|uniref:Alkaline phosphatase family protein n=1 Tax=Acrocarpospora pleiomorpha TaxID=90975 RepID=A0A5M3XPV7_9ACTN|nr:alkaline phosphatase family protein [Acrocarpospora pleiomorpha]GES22776.1 hypothetical protein Aple_056750 [Acrocarpospora pleiomorpha]
MNHHGTRRLAERVLVVVWDGMRPDLITADGTPRLFELARGGTTFTRASSVYAPMTRPASASISTGCHPGRHGIHGNLMPYPGRADRVLHTGDLAQLAELRRFHDGRLTRVETLAEAVHRRGGRFAVLTTGTAGQASLLDAERVGVLVNPDLVYPETAATRIEARFGAPPPKTVPADPLNTWLVDVLLEYILPEVEPDAAVVWLCEPDNSQHATGLGTEQARAGIASSDRQLGRILDWIERDGTPTAVIVTSDHGHTTVSGYVDVAAELAAAGFGGLLDDGLIRPLEGQLAAAESLPERESGRIVEWFAAQAWVDTFVSWGHAPADRSRTVAVEKLWAGHGQDLPTLPLLAYTHPWTREVNEHGVAGAALVSPVKAHRAMHGSLSPDELVPTLVLGGAGIRAAVSDRPAGIIDIVATVQTLLGHDALLPTDGRVLWEALDTGDGTQGGDDGEVSRERLVRQGGGWLVRDTYGSGAYLAVEIDESQ